MGEPFAPELVSMAQIALKNLPDNWEMQITTTEFGEIPFFCNLETNYTSWTHPFQEEYRYLIAEKRDELMVVGSNDQLVDYSGAEQYDDNTQYDEDQLTLLQELHYGEE